jgi:hypothetical protein
VDVEVGEHAGDAAHPRRRLHYRVAFAITASVLLAIAVTLPFSVAGIVDDLLGPPSGKVIDITTTPHDAAAAAHSLVHVAFVALDEIELMATLRISGHYVCRGDCESSHRIILVSVTADDAQAEGLPPSATFTLPPAGEAFSQTFDLPIRGYPIHYPFDRYQMILGVALQRIHADGRVETLPPDQARGQLFLSIQELLPRQNMSAPVVLEPQSIRSEGDPFPYLNAFAVSFERPRYVRVLAVLLVVLIAAAAAYSVFLRPLPELFVNSGALVLGVWGIRAILVPGSLAYLTAVDLALSTVIIFLLGALTVRVLVYMHDRGELRILRRRRSA